MIKVAFFIFVCGVWAFPAQARKLPQGLCDHWSECSKEQKEIFDRFMSQGQGIQTIEREAVYSGVCFWGRPYRPSDEHHGALFFYNTEKGGELAFKGRLSYYAGKNPYRNFSSKEARRYWFDRDKDLIPTQYTDYAFYDANPEGEGRNRIWYWFRQDQSQADRVYMIAYFGSSQGYCDLTRN